MGLGLEQFWGGLVQKCSPLPAAMQSFSPFFD
jgi:hypothetical protein